MLSVRGIYENGKIELLEPIQSMKRAKVIVTILEELDETEDQNQEVDLNIFDELVGAVSVREDGSITHDRYIASWLAKNHAGVPLRRRRQKNLKHPVNPVKGSLGSEWAFVES